MTRIRKDFSGMRRPFREESGEERQCSLCGATIKADEPRIRFADPGDGMQHPACRDSALVAWRAAKATAVPPTPKPATKKARPPAPGKCGICKLPLGDGERSAHEACKARFGVK